MDRLVYAPKVQAYVQTGDGIVDLTDFIVEGQVDRNVNAISTASLTIQNPDKRFTKPGNPTFRPMDSIKIYLSRFREHPVLVFTGYLDETPYLQLHPGTCELKASCTLKRLQYTYWDPGLKFTREFLNKHHWRTQAQGGTVYKPSRTVEDDGETGDGKPPPKIEDGSIGNLIWLVLNQIGKWDRRDIRIEAMPKSLSKTIEDIYLGMRQDDEELNQEVTQFLKDMIGEYTGGTPIAGTPTPPGGGGGGGSGGAVEIGCSFYDLPGVGSCGDLQENLDHAYAELGYGGAVGNAMGDLDCGYEITVSYGGKTKTIQKCDVGTGGGDVEGQPRGIDLSGNVARWLGIPATAGVAVLSVTGLPPGTVVRGQGGASVTVPEGGDGGQGNH